MLLGNILFLSFLLGLGNHVYLALLGLLPIIGELKCCGDLLDGAESTDHIGQLASEQKCIDAVIDGTGVLHSTLFTNCYCCMSSRSLGLLNRIMLMLLLLS